MKKTIFFLLTALMVSLLTSCTNETDTRTFDDFLEAFNVAFGDLDDDDDNKPFYSMIGAKDAVLVEFFSGKVRGEVLKIYQYENEKIYKQASKDFPIVKYMAKNGLFVAESNSEELLEFFKGIPKNLKSAEAEETISSVGADFN